MKAPKLITKKLALKKRTISKFETEKSSHKKDFADPTVTTTSTISF